MSNTARNKIKQFSQLLALGSQIVLKQKLHYFLFCSTITIKLEIRYILL